MCGAKRIDEPFVELLNTNIISSQQKRLITSAVEDKLFAYIIKIVYWSITVFGS